MDDTWGDLRLLVRLSVLSHLNRVESSMLRAHHLRNIKWLRHVWRLLLGGNLLTNSIDNLGATEQLRPWEGKLLVWPQSYL